MCRVRAAGRSLYMYIYICSNLCELVVFCLFVRLCFSRIIVGPRIFFDRVCRVILGTD